MLDNTSSLDTYYLQQLDKCTIKTMKIESKVRSDYTPHDINCLRRIEDEANLLKLIMRKKREDKKVDQYLYEYLEQARKDQTI